MSYSPDSVALEIAAIQLADHLSGYAATLHEFARAVAAGEGTVQLGRQIPNLETKRVELQERLDAVIAKGVPQLATHL